MLYPLAAATSWIALKVVQVGGPRQSRQFLPPRQRCGIDTHLVATVVEIVASAIEREPRDAEDQGEGEAEDDERLAALTAPVRNHGPAFEGFHSIINLQFGPR